MAFCWEGRPFHPSSAEASCLLTPSHWGSGAQRPGPGQVTPPVFHPKLVNFRAGFMTLRFVRLTGVQTIRGGGIQEGLSKLVAGTWGLQGQASSLHHQLFADCISLCCAG